MVAKKRASSQARQRCVRTTVAEAMPRRPWEEGFSCGMGGRVLWGVVMIEVASPALVCEVEVLFRGRPRCG